VKIGIISDTHGCLTTWQKIYHQYFSDADLIIHAGDVLYHGPRNPIPAEYNPKQLAEALNDCPIPLVIACGNCDAEVDSMVLKLPIQSPYAYIMLNGLRVLVNHGHHLTEEGKWEIAEKYKIALYITGHTHIASLEKRKGIVYLNPGAPAMSKRSDGRGTIARLVDGIVEVLDVESGQVLFVEEL
jgi:hypothetical protein